MNALHDEKEEAAISEEEKAITWRGEPVASDDLHGITYRNQFAVEPKGTVFRVGDSFRCATKRQGAEDDDYLEATMPADASSEEQPSICKLRFLWADSRGKQWALCENFYMPEDTVFGRKPYHGSKELLKGEYAERQLLAEDIKAKVTIEEFSVYHEREVFPEDVYYWRQEYYVRPKARAPSPPTLSLRKRTKEDREKSDHARNASLVEKHTKMVEKLIDRRRRSEARRLAEDQKRQLEEEQRRPKALTRDATRTTIEIDEDSDHDNEVNEPTEKQAEEIALLAPFESVAMVVDDGVVEQKKAEEDECETVTETATKAEVVETDEGQNGAVETASPPASYAGTASASNRLPSPTPSPHEILQTPPTAVSPARKRLRRTGGPTLSSLSALSASGSSSMSAAPYSSTSTRGASTASSLSSLAAARREAQQVSLVPLSQRGRGKHEAIEVNSDDDDTASVLAQPLPPVVPSVSSSQPQLARRPPTKLGAEYEPAVAQERGSRWKMYTQESPDDALQNQTTVSLKANTKPRKKRVDVFKFPSDDEEEASGHEEAEATELQLPQQNLQEEEEDSDFAARRSTRILKARKLKQGKVLDMLQGSKQSAALSAPPLPTATTGPAEEEERADGAEPAGLGQAERGPKTKTGAHTRSFLVHPPKQVMPHSPSLAILRSLQKPTHLSHASHSPSSSQSLSSSSLSSSARSLLSSSSSSSNQAKSATSTSTNTGRADPVTLYLDEGDGDELDEEKHSERKRKREREKERPSVEEKSRKPLGSSGGGLLRAHSAERAASTSTRPRSRRSSITSSKQVFLESDEIVEEVGDQQNDDRRRRKAAATEKTGRKRDLSPNRGISTTTTTSKSKSDKERSDSESSSTRTTRRRAANATTRATTKLSCKAGSDNDRSATTASAEKKKTTGAVSLKRKKLEDELLAEFEAETEPLGSSTSRRSTRHRKRPRKVEEEEDEEEEEEQPEKDEEQEEEEEKGRRKSRRTRTRVTAREKMDRQRRRLEAGSSDEDEEGEAEQSEEEGEEEEDEMAGFIVDDDDHDDEAQAKLDAMLGRGKGLPESFSVYVQYLISGCLDPDFVTSLSSKDSYFLPARRKIEDAVVSRKESLVSSSAWVPGFRHALESLPNYHSWPAGSALKKDCEACKRTNHRATYQLELSGPHYDTRAYWSGSISFGEVNESKEGKAKYRLGKQCHARTKLFHTLHHYQYMTQQLVDRRVESVLGTGVDETQVVQKLMDDQGFLSKLFDEFQALLKRADNFRDDPKDHDG